jgi:hypothetical protein
MLMLVCVMIAIFRGAACLTAERLQPAEKNYLDARANALVSLCIYVTCFLAGVRDLQYPQAQLHSPEYSDAW